MFFCSTPCMSLPTFSELYVPTHDALLIEIKSLFLYISLASLHLSSNGEPDSEAGVAESHHSPPISPTNINTHNHTRSRSTSISSSGCIQTSTNHFPSTSPSIIISHSDPSHSIFNTHHHHHHHHHSTPATTPATTPVVATGTESNVRSRHSTTRSIIRFTPYLGASKSVKGSFISFKISFSNFIVVIWLVLLRYIFAGIVCRTTCKKLRSPIYHIE